MDNERSNIEEEQRESVYECGMIETKNSKGRIKSLSIIGTVEGHSLLPPGTKTTKYEHVIPHLVAAEEDEEVDGLLVLLNTTGGDVEAGLAIAEMISGMSKPTVSIVLGGSHSIGVPLAVSCDKSFIVPSATMTIHPMRICGVVIGAEQTYRYFEMMQSRIAEFIVRNSKISRDELLKLMLATDKIANDVGTILFGEQAVEKGIIDSVGGLSDAISCLYSLIEEKKTYIEY